MVLGNYVIRDISSMRHKAGSDPTQGYHLEMSTDEMATMFLHFLEKD